MNRERSESNGATHMPLEPCGIPEYNACVALPFWFLVILPAILVALGSDPGFPHSLAKAAGVTATSAFAVSLILGCRARWLDRAFGSLGRAYHAHHQLGIAALALATLHVTLASLPFAEVELVAALEFLGDWRDPVVATGWLALGLLAAGALFSYLRKIRRRTWRWLHRTILASFAAALAHFYLGAASLGAGELLSAVLCLLALLFSVVHLAFPSALRRRHAYRVGAVKALGPQEAELTFLPEGDPLRFFPGQYAFLSVECAGPCGISADFHPYTLASSPGEPGLRLAVRALGSDSSRLLGVSAGTPAVVEGPYGNLLTGFDPARPQLWISGGIGVTPFVSYVRHWKESPARLEKVVLLRLVKHLDEDIFGPELSAATGLRTFAHVDDLEGPPRLGELLPPDWRERDIALSGPSVMVKKFRRELRKLGKSGREIRSEEFDF